MRFVEYLETCLEHAVTVLRLPRLAKGTFQLLVRLDLDSEFAERVQEEDPHHRSGVLSWAGLASDFLERGGDIIELEQTISVVERWGLVQVVGRSPKDPVVPGASALRLTHAGRACLGLGPGRTRLPEGGRELGPWEVWHCSSRERLVVHARQTHAELVADTVSLRDDVEAWVAAGQCAMGICLRGGVIVDGFDLGDRGTRLVEVLLRRTASAGAPRILLLPDPSRARLAAVYSGARLRWIEPEIETRRDRVVLDRAVSRSLEEAQGAASQGDLLGVPDSEIAVPRRVQTDWKDLIVPTKVQWELRQVLVHARFRLEDLPGMATVGRKRGYRLLLSGLPGTGKSLCAEALATTLNRPLVKLDLSSVLSKWLGETEKLLAQVFDVAEAADAVLVLDEAESLLRQRGDKGGGGGGLGALSTGVAYLLTRLDRYTGVLVATTNRTRDLDEAFFRRFDDFVVLPIPDAPTRKRLWLRMLDLDEVDEVDEDELNLDFVAGQFAISGGLIRGAAIRAQAWAVGLDHALDTPLVLASLARELDKNDRSAVEVLVQPYKQAVQELLDGVPEA